MSKGKIIAQYIFYTIFRPFMWLYFVVFQHVRFKRNGYKIPKGPIVILSNHHSNWDGIWLNAMFKTRIIHFIVHDEMFKNKALSFVSGTLLGEIKRGPNHQDVGPVKEMFKLRKQGKTIGIFPEGDIHMFGRTLPIAPSIAKLVKKLNVPVVCLSLTGAHLRATRVAKYAYHSHITYNVKDVIMPEDLANMSVEEVHTRIVNDISVDEMKWQRKAKIKQYGKKRAEWLELGLFCCPKCHKMETMKSHNNHFYCKECGFDAKLNKYSFFESNFPMEFDCTSLWDDWQLEQLKQYLHNLGENEIAFKRDDLDVYFTPLGSFFKKPYDKANIMLYKDRITFTTKKEGKTKTFLLKDISRAYLQYKDVLEIIIDNERYRFRSKKRDWSAYLYVKAIEFLLQEQNDLV